MVYIEKLNDAIKEKNVDLVKQIMQEHDLVLKDNKIVPNDASEFKKQEQYWDQMQQIRKILLNSLK